MTETEKAAGLAVTTSAVEDVLNKVAKASDNTLAKRDVPEITAAVAKEVNSIVVNATNNEPWYQSRVTIGAFITLIGATYALVLDFTDGTIPNVDALTAQLGTIAGAVTVLYGRWVARKPIGE